MDKSPPHPQNIEGSSMFLGSSDVAISGSDCSSAGRDVAKIVVQNYNIFPGIEAGSSSKQDRARAAGHSLETAHSPSPWYSMNRLIRALKATQDQEIEDEKERRETATASGSKRACQPKLEPIAEIIDLLHTNVATNNQTVVKNEACMILPINAGNSNSTNIPEIYTHHMFIYALGYPLYIPEPDHGLSSEYREKGVRIGDVGSITAEGAFDFLFNICLPADHPINPSHLPDSFEMLPSSDISIIPQFIAQEDCRYSDGVDQLDDQPNKFHCTTSEGAVLVLPAGATLFKAKNTPIFQDFAARHAENWYKYMVDKGRHTPNGSLYLITGCIKSINWANATFYKGPSPGNFAQLVATNAQPAYRWRRLGKVSPRTGPISEETGELNQCEFLYGFKIMLRQDLLDKLSSTVSVSSQEGQRSVSRSTKAPAPNSDFGGTGSSTSSSTTREEPSAENGSTSSRSHNSGFSSEVIIEADFPTAPPLHPSDLINTTLLKSDPSAKVAITHDAVWCATLLKFATSKSNFTMDDIFDAIAERYRSTTDKFGCISLAGEDLNVYEGICDDVEMFGATTDHLKKDATTTKPNILESFDQVEQELDVPLRKVVGSLLSSQQAFTRSEDDPIKCQEERNRQWLNDYVGKRHLGELIYEDNDQLIPGNRHIWTSTVQLDGTSYGLGRAGSKGGAREQAAKMALAALEAKFGPNKYDEY